MHGNVRSVIGVRGRSEMSIVKVRRRVRLVRVGLRGVGAVIANEL